MAHVAKIHDGIVVEINVINNEDLPNNGSFSLETEQAANDFQHNLGLDGVWKLVSYNSNFRGRYPSLGDTYSEELDKFIDSPEPIDADVFNKQVIDAQKQLAESGFTLKEIEQATGHPCFDDIIDLFK